MKKQLQAAIAFIAIATLLFAFAFLCFASQLKTHTAHEITRLSITPLENNDFILASSFFVLIDGKVLEIPKSFETDLASIPRILWSFYPPQRYKYIMAGVAHDYLYSCHEGLSRKDADDILYSLLIDNGATKFTALKFYLAVRVFGSSHYKNNNCPIRGGWLNASK